jgi:hypothetical protein
VVGKWLSKMPECRSEALATLSATVVAPDLHQRRSIDRKRLPHPLSTALSMRGVRAYVRARRPPLLRHNVGPADRLSVTSMKSSCQWFGSHRY